MKNLLFSFSFAIVCLFSTQASANLITNGSFEQFHDNQTPVVLASGAWLYEVLPGWTSSNNIEVQADGFLANAADGNYYAELNGHAAENDIPFTIQQEFSTEVGQQYRLSFYAQKRQIDDGSFNVSVGSLNEEIYTHVIDNFTLYTFLFTAAESLSTLSFISNQSNADTIGHFLDDVEVTAIPLPGTLALFAAGLLGIGSIRKTTANT